MCGYLQKQFSVSVERSCTMLGIHRSMWYNQSKKDDQELIDKLSELAQQLPTRGFDEYFSRIRQEGLKRNRIRVLRVYRKMRLSLMHKYKKSLPQRFKVPLLEPEAPNQTWSTDFMSDSLSDGRKIQVQNITVDYNR